MAQEEDTSYNAVKDRLLNEVKKAFKPEFFNRIDDIIVFRNLTKEDLTEIIKLEVNEVIERLKGRGIDISLSPEAMDFLMEKGYDPLYGARPLKRTIQRYVEDMLSEEIISGRFKEGSKVTVVRRDDNLVLALNNEYFGFQDSVFLPRNGSVMSGNWQFYGRRRWSVPLRLPLKVSFFDTGPAHRAGQFYHLSPGGFFRGDDHCLADGLSDGTAFCRALYP